MTAHNDVITVTVRGVVVPTPHRCGALALRGPEKGHLASQGCGILGAKPQQAGSVKVKADLGQGEIPA